MSEPKDLEGASPRADGPGARGGADEESSETLPSATVPHETVSSDTVPAATLPDTDSSETVPAETVPRTPAPESSTPASGGVRLSETHGKLPDLIAGRFEVQTLLGKGGLGRVYLVRDRQIQGREVALKVLRTKYSKNPRFKKLFFEEVRAAQGFVHEHVNQVRDTGEAPETGELFLTMDLVEGESLRRMVKRENSLATRHALEIVRQVLLGLQSGHEHGLIHRDVKPENVMLAARIPKTEDNPYGVGVRLLDFGLAGVAAEVGEGVISGTPMYMSPEQAQGQRLDARSDLFAVGIVLYEMIAGTRPFHGKTVDNIITSVIETDVTPLIERLEHLDKPVRRILARALEKKRDKRFPSADEFIRAIEKSRAYQIPKETPAWTLAALGLMSVAAAGAGGLWWQTNAAYKHQSGDLETARNEVDSLQSRMQGMTEDHRKAIDEYERQLSERETRMVDAGRSTGDEIVILQEDVKRLEMQTGILDKQVGTLSTDLTEEKKRNTNLEQARDALAKEVRDLGDKLSGYESRNVLEYVAANGLDKILVSLRNQDGERARSKYYELIDEDVIAKKGRLDGQDFLAALTDAAVHLQNHVDAADSVRRKLALEDAAQGLARANELFPRFQEYVRPWVGYATDDAEVPDRIAQIETLLQAYGRELESAAAAAAAGRESDWETAVSLAQAERDLAAVVGLARTFGDDRLERYVSDYAAWLRADCQSQGEVRLDALQRAKHLDSWGATLASERELSELAGARDVCAFWFAKCWYDGDPKNDDALDWSLAPTGDPSATDPAKDWRQELKLKHRLSRGDSAYPGGTDSRFLYRAQNPEGDVSWRLEQTGALPQPLQGAVRSWETRRSFYNEGGSALPLKESVPMLFTGGFFAEEGKRGSPVLRLDRTDGLGVEYRVALWSPAERPEVPNRLPVPPNDVESFWGQVEGRSFPCLVVIQDGSESWFSPDWGRIRVVDPNGISLELAFANVVR